MGCLQSRKDSGDIHPNVFRVVNIDEGGAGLWSGQLEVTDSELVLYREGRDATVWPLRCLRRYGFDGDIFSFESGRRCTTGEGIYAFRCRRAGMLFRTLQQNIQLRNMVSESLPFQLPINILPGTTASLPRSLHVNIVNTHSPQRTSVTTESRSVTSLDAHPPPTPARPPISAVSTSPRSPSNNEILEVMPLSPRTGAANASQISNFYQKQDFRMREYNNNRSDAVPEHFYYNDFSRDLAALRTILKKETARNTLKDIEEEKNLLKSQYMNEVVPLCINPPMSPTISETSEHYARLTLENSSDRPYMNLGSLDSTTLRCMQIHMQNSNNCNTFNFSISTDVRPLSNNTKEEINMYANVNVGEMLEQMQNKLQPKVMFPDVQKKTESDALHSLSLLEELEVNYAILDIETSRDGTPGSPDSCWSSHNDGNPSPPSSAAPKLVSQTSIEKSTSNSNKALGYTTIDFDKTVALTSVASGAAEVETEGSRKIRLNSIGVNSPNTVDKK